MGPCHNTHSKHWFHDGEREEEGEERSRRRGGRLKIAVWSVDKEMALAREGKASGT